jgi:hypothetical protein
MKFSDWWFRERTVTSKFLIEYLLVPLVWMVWHVVVLLSTIGVGLTRFSDTLVLDGFFWARKAWS